MSEFEFAFLIQRGVRARRTRNGVCKLTGAGRGSMEKMPNNVTDSYL